MRIVAVTRVLDEADVIEAFARHTAAYVDHHIFLDGGSADGTLAILTALHRDGLPLTVLQTRCVSFNEATHFTQLFRRAVLDHGADWVACLDADEFVDDRFVDDRGSPVAWRALLAALSDADPAVVNLRLPMTEYVTTSHDDPAQPLVPLRIGWRRAPGSIGKAVARGGRDRAGAAILAGGHAVLPDGPDGPPGVAVQQPGLSLAHYAERSPYQVIAKFVRGWTRVLAAPPAVAASGASYHYKHPFELLRHRPAEVLRNPAWAAFHHDHPDLVHDPIRYRGGPLRHTGPTDDAMRAVQGLMGVLHDLALRHGRLLDTFPDVRQQVAAWDAELTRLL